MRLCYTHSGCPELTYNITYVYIVCIFAHAAIIRHNAAEEAQQTPHTPQNHTCPQNRSYWSRMCTIYAKHNTHTRFRIICIHMNMYINLAIILLCLTCPHKHSTDQPRFVSVCCLCAVRACLYHDRKLYLRMAEWRLYGFVPMLYFTEMKYLGVGFTFSELGILHIAYGIYASWILWNVMQNFVFSTIICFTIILLLS